MTQFLKDLQQQLWQKYTFICQDIIRVFGFTAQDKKLSKSELTNPGFACPKEESEHLGSIRRVSALQLLWGALGHLFPSNILYVRCSECEDRSLSYHAINKKSQSVVLRQISLKVKRLNMRKPIFLPLKLLHIKHFVELMLRKFTAIKEKKMQQPRWHQDWHQYYWPARFPASVNFYGKLISCLSALVKPLTELL